MSTTSVALAAMLWCTMVPRALAFGGGARGHILDALAGGRPRIVKRAMASTVPAPEADTLGFLGIGIMGNGMARRLLSHGYKLKVWNRSESKAEELRDAYKDNVHVCSTPAQVVSGVSRTFSMMSTPEAARAVYTMQEGVLEAIRPGKAIVDCATLEPEDMVEWAEAVSARGGRFLEAPVSGSKVPAETGTLVFMCSGDQHLYDEVQPMLAVMGKSSHYLGDVGAASRMKLVVNMIMATMMTSLAEGISLADKCGLNSDQLLEVLSQGAMANPMFALKGQKVIQRSHPPNFPLKHARKDLSFAVSLASERGCEVPTASAALGLYDKAMALHAESDFAAVAEALRSSP